jgi:hypothetical protein
VNLLGGRNYAGATRLISIASGYAVNIQYGDPVVLVAAGTIERMNATTTATTVTNTGGTAGFAGVFVGCQYTDATTGFITRQTYVSGTVATDIMAMVVDDPDALFQLQANGTLAQASLGANAAIIQTVAGAGTYMPSGLQLQISSVATTATLPVRIVDFVNAPGSTIGDAFTDVIVRINTHFQRQTSGI